LHRNFFFSERSEVSAPVQLRALAGYEAAFSPLYTQISRTSY
jgi:hypothetical protein